MPDRSAPWSCCSCAPAAGPVDPVLLSGLQQSLPFIDRLQETERRYTASRPDDGERALAEVQSLAFEEVCFAYNARTPGAHR